MGTGFSAAVSPTRTRPGRKDSVRRRPNPVVIILRTSTMSFALALRPEISAASAATASVNAAARAPVLSQRRASAGTGSQPLAAARPWPSLPVSSRWRPPSPLRLTTRRLRCAASPVVERITQPHRISNRAQRLVGDDDADIGNVKRPPIRCCGNPRHIGDDVVELRAQHSDERLYCFGLKFRISAQRLLSAQHEETLTVNRHNSLEKDVVDAQRIGESLTQSRCRPEVSARAQSPFCRSRSRSRIRRFCRSARYHARLIASVVVPTPPRAPTTATTFPSFRLIGLLSGAAGFGDRAFANSCGVTGLTMYSLTPPSRGHDRGRYRCGRRSRSP